MKTRYLELPEGQLAYDDAGLGPLVICVPGLGDLRAEYRFLVPQLVASGYRVVTLDLRGHGGSSVGWADYSKTAIGTDILALIRHLDAGPAFVVGTSYAAGAAVSAAAQAPDLVAGIALVGPFVRDSQTPQQRARASWLYGTLFAWPWGVAAWGMYYPTLYPTHKPTDFAAYRRALLANLRQRGRLTALRAMMTSYDARSVAALAGVRCPALVVMGSRDPDFKHPAEEARQIAEKLRASVTTSVTMIEGAGHYPHAEMPDQTAPAIIGFLNRVRSVPGHGEGHGEQVGHGA